MEGGIETSTSYNCRGRHQRSGGVCGSQRETSHCRKQQRCVVGEKRERCSLQWDLNGAGGSDNI